MMCTFVSAVLSIVDASLSSIWIFGVKPDFESSAMMEIVALFIYAAFLVFSNLVMMPLLFQS